MHAVGLDGGRGREGGREGEGGRAGGTDSDREEGREGWRKRKGVSVKAANKEASTAKQAWTLYSVAWRKKGRKIGGFLDNLCHSSEDMCCLQQH